MSEVVYSGVKFTKMKKSDQRGDKGHGSQPEPGITVEDVTYAEVRFGRVGEKHQQEPATERVPVSFQDTKSQRTEDGHRNLQLALLIISILVLVIIITVSLLFALNSSGDRNTEEVCEDCEPGWEYLSGKCYFFSTDTHTWDESQKLCVSMKAHLAIIDNEEEQNALMLEVKNKMSDDEHKFWIGLTDKEHEGTWLWADNTSLVKSFWLNIQPDDWKGLNDEYPDGEDCVRMGERNYMGGSFTGWVDTACNRNFRRICEKDSCNITNDA
ncbi:immune-related, lectin-like receptor 4 [Denticeps clupeoides]|uniref:immune-related, lectin-like receptor 4 n=1 Tax=Denticeps clupeoides TaxID=299321 RepID=UPI0010A51D77|nr:hepatic lectin-like [Denticeps clupeoides]XP_028820643.1 hepatic lectin-like [Denticeps clupeoides]XP_028820644.1 hepatic lectin-like [Denticeps clupeoides]XP_028820646.1 hepatic lectin-like [Denticeps clupeoides]XP_028820647.1 hepatic lectin-like [Denticeps clupeoides]